ncbi:glycosyltransferase [Phocaeicola dorei]|uniref:glycosyltransferase n=1 Tax=Phocaeicola dorei TaxID=357276 RepID=UPI0039B398E8
MTQNFLNALQHASGKYIFLADQDDVWASDRIKEVLQCLKRHEGTLVVCNASLIDAREKQLNKAFITRIP